MKPIGRARRPGPRLSRVISAGLLLWAGFLLWSCAASEPQKEISSVFLSFLADVKAGNNQGVFATAPFLATLSSSQRDAALGSFRSYANLASQDATRLRMQVAPGARGTYVLQVSVPGGGAGILVPFHKNDQGRWEMSPVLETIQHIDVVPAE